MIDIIAEILKDELSALSFSDVVAGLSRPVTKKDGEKDKTFPTSINTTTTCNTSQLKDLVPNSSKKSIMYFEDNGTSVLETQRRKIHYESNIRLICWYNLKKINQTLTDDNKLIANILKTITKRLDNQDYITGIRVIQNGIPVRDGLFNEYDYDEVNTQFMTYPFGAFGIDLIVTYYVMTSSTCITDITINADDCY